MPVRMLRPSRTWTCDLRSFGLRDLYGNLERDEWRLQNPFSPDIAAANAVLFDAYATRSDCETQVMRWLQRNQTCIFGKVAAARQNLHVAILTDGDIQTKDDGQIADWLQDELLTWKRRSLRPITDFSTPGHGFVLVLASQRLADAAPDRNLRLFSDKVRELWGCRPSRDAVGEIHWETLFLQHPIEQRFWKFTFSVDFFGAQGDRRWWHDHRAPGGLMFTANSAGYMRMHRELYEGKATGQREWVIQSAMKTIADAAATPWGPATWLKRLDPNGQPVVRSVSCPFAEPSGLKAEMAGRDWTRYGGFLHSDHSIRMEFFSSKPDRSGDVSRQEHLQDFTYLYDESTRDYATFMGVEVSAQEIGSTLGAVETWTRIPRGGHPGGEPGQVSMGFGAPFAEPALGGAIPTPLDRRRMDALLKASEEWRLQEAELRTLDAG